MLPVRHCSGNSLIRVYSCRNCRIIFLVPLETARPDYGTLCPSCLHEARCIGTKGAGRWRPASAAGRDRDDA